MNKNKLIYILLGLVLIVGALIAFPLFSPGGEGQNGPDADTAASENRGTPEIVTIDIACVGDVMAHITQVQAAALGDGTYSFEKNFEFIKDYITKADIALCNIETTFGGEPYRGYPAFSSPDVLAGDLAEAGFNVALTANNHMHDRGGAGITRTLEVLKKNGFVTTGSMLREDEPRYAMINVKGIDVAVIAYTYETPSPDGAVYLNGVRIAPENAARINSFSYENIDVELKEIGSVVEEARENGAEIVVMYYHWGEEYQLAANKWQRYIAEKTVETMNVDIIFGSHPHNLQEAEYIDGVPVFFSMGNFISNQRTETLGAEKRYTETGVIAQVKIDYNKTDNEVVSAAMSAVPTWVDRYSEGGRTVYSIIPLDSALDSNAVLAESGHLTRAKGALEDANGLLKIN